MGIFVTPMSNLFVGLTNTPTVILTATTNVLWLSSIVVCNRGIQSIRLNLQHITPLATTSLAYQVPVNSYKTASNVTGDLNTIDLAAICQLRDVSLNVGEQLVIFSDGYSQGVGSTQVYDVTVYYNLSEELPMA